MFYFIKKKSVPWGRIRTVKLKITMLLISGIKPSDLINSFKSEDMFRV